MKPHAREDGLITKDAHDEVLVYDRTRHRAHYLNRTAALIWRRCDGKTTIGRIARDLEIDLERPVDEAVVWLALERLGKAHLLRAPVAPPAGAPRLSRRQLIRRVALVGGATLLLPVVASILAPTAAHAASCTGADSCPQGNLKCQPCGPNCDKFCAGNGSGPGACRAIVLGCLL